ncbi:uncharacterized protein LOC119487978 [Sebastes umbrosus]|uniref:uncharacterized protein LOC119487978 n=1 Tax=Sebastes umbrosus TaxID=72105 RepID=UPI0018A06EE3|nr:uncharacterized protein LOC119487978 [Sebastes umbrosus]
MTTLWAFLSINQGRVHLRNKTSEAARGMEREKERITYRERGAVCLWRLELLRFNTVSVSSAQLTYNYYRSRRLPLSPDPPGTPKTSVKHQSAKQTLTADMGSASTTPPRCQTPCQRPSAPAKCRAGTHGGDDGRRAEVTEVSLSLTHTLRTWTQRQTHTVGTVAHLKGGRLGGRVDRLLTGQRTKFLLCKILFQNKFLCSPCRCPI